MFLTSPVDYYQNQNQVQPASWAQDPVFLLKNKFINKHVENWKNII